VSGVLAHGGWAGLMVEIAALLAILALGLAFWVGNRREGQERRNSHDTRS
jgi:hypothetical protein